MRLATAGVAALGVAAFGAEAALARRPSVARSLSGPVQARVEIQASIERVWAVMTDIPGQVRWMPEMKAVRILTPGPVRRGTVAEAYVRILGIGVRDRVVITTFEPMATYGIEHQALFRGAGELRLRPGLDRTTTIVDWEETLVPPILPRLGWIAGRPFIGYLYQRDLFLLRDIVEDAAVKPQMT